MFGIKSHRERQLEQDVISLVHQNANLQRELSEAINTVRGIKGQYYSDRQALRNANKGLLRLSRKCRRLRNENENLREAVRSGSDHAFRNTGIEVTEGERMPPHYGGIKPLKFTVPAGVGGMEVEDGER